MKFFIFLSCFFVFLNAKATIISQIPPPSQEIINTSVINCNTNCMNNLFKEGFYVSYIALFTDNNLDDSVRENKILKSNFQIATSFIDSFILTNYKIYMPDKIKLSLLIPQKIIGRYLVTIPDSIISYLISRNIDFEFKVFNSQDESLESLRKEIVKIIKEDYKFVIAILTNDGLKNLVYIKNDLLFFIPTININQAKELNNISKIIFGGINYEEQLQMINNYAKSANASLIVYNDNSNIGKMLGNLTSLNSNRIVISNLIDTKQSSNFESYVKEAKKYISKSLVLLNTSTIKSGLIISQFINKSAVPINFVSTQINFNPSILNLTQSLSENKLLIVNSIGAINKKLLTNGSLINSDFSYDWVNYSTGIGVEFFVEIVNPKIEKMFREVVKNNQVQYKNKFYKAKNFHFVD